MLTHHDSTYGVADGTVWRIVFSMLLSEYRPIGELNCLCWTCIDGFPFSVRTEFYILVGWVVWSRIVGWIVGVGGCVEFGLEFGGNSMHNTNENQMEGGAGLVQQNMWKRWMFYINVVTYNFGLVIALRFVAKWSQSFLRKVCITKCDGLCINSSWNNTQTSYN